MSADRKDTERGSGNILLLVTILFIVIAFAVPFFLGSLAERGF